MPSISERSAIATSNSLKIHATRFPSLTSPGKAICVGTTWAEWSNSITQRGCPELSDKLQGELVNGVRLAEGGKRGNASVLEVSLVPIDLDGVTPEELEATIDRLDVEGLAYLCHSTHSHGNDGLACARIWLPLAHALAASAFKPVWGATIDRFAPSADRQCNDVGRGYFLPYCQPGRSATAFVFAREGRPYEPEVSVGGERPATTPTSGTRDVSSEVLVDVAKKWRRSSDPKKIDLADRLIRTSRGEAFAGEGERDGTFFAILNEIVAALPDISAASLRTFFARSIDRMQMENPEGALTLDSIDEKLSRIRQYAAERAARYIPFEGADTHDRFAAQYYAENPALRIFNGASYTGNIKALNEQDVRVHAGKFLRRFSVKGEPINVNIQRVSELLEALARTRAYVSGDVPCFISSGERPPTCIVFSNGRLELDGTFHEADPDLFAPYALPWAFDPAQLEAPRWVQFNTEIGLRADEITFLQEWFGYTLAGATHLQKFVWIRGVTRSGKSLITSMLSSLMGEQNVGACDEKQLGSQFGLAAQYDKSLIVMAELNKAIPKEATDRIKKIVGHDKLGVERKGREDLHVYFPGRIMCTSNAMPVFEDANATALLTRLVVLETRVSFRDREDTGLGERIFESEASGIIRWALVGLARLRANGKFSEPQSSVDCKSKLSKNSSRFHQFADECTVDARANVSLQIFCNVFRDWQRSVGDKTHVSQSAIETMIESAALPGVKVVRSREGALRKYSVTGLILPQTHEGIGASICEWIVKWLLEPRVRLSPEASHKLCILDNKPIVNVGVIAENWGVYFPNQTFKAPSTAQIGMALESLSESSEVLEGDLLCVVSVSSLEAWAAHSGYCTAAKIQVALAKANRA